jgi:lysophospholipase L1-like esterase
MKTCLVIGDSHVDSSGLALPLRSELEKLGYSVTMAGVGATAATTWTNKNPVCRPKKDKCIDKDKLPKGVDLLVVSLGTNDCANASAANADKKARAEENLKLIQSLKDAFGAKDMFWIGPPQMSDGMKHYTNENMDYIYKAADAAGVKIFDSRPVTKKLRETSGDQDAVHFYGKKGRPWAEAVAKAIKESESKINVGNVAIYTTIAIAALVTVVLIARKK